MTIRSPRLSPASNAPVVTAAIWARPAPSLSMIVAMSAWLRGISTSGWRDHSPVHTSSTSCTARSASSASFCISATVAPRRSATIRLESPRRVRTGPRSQRSRWVSRPDAEPSVSEATSQLSPRGTTVRYCSRSVLVVVPTSR